MAAGRQADTAAEPVSRAGTQGRGPVTAYLEVSEPGQRARRVVTLSDTILIGRAGAAEDLRQAGPHGQQPHNHSPSQRTSQRPVQPAETAPAGPFLGIDDHTVSRRHARIQRAGADHVIEDLHSVNGTYVEGERLAAGAVRALGEGDTVRIGSARLVFHCIAAEPMRGRSDAGVDDDAAASSTPLVASKIVGSIDATRYACLAGEGNAPDGRAAGQALTPGVASGAGPAATRNISPALFQATLRKLHAMAQVGIALGVVRDRATLVEKLMQFMFDLFPLADRAFMLICEPPVMVHAGARAPASASAGAQASASAAAGAAAHGSAPAGAAAPASAAAVPVPAAARRRDGRPLDPASIRLSHTILQAVLTQRRAILCADSLSDLDLASQDSILAQPLRSIMCVPLLLETECLGMIQVDTGRDPHAFDADDLELLTGVCAQAAVTLKTFLLYADIEHLLDGFVTASVQAIEERDPVTAGHSSRVAEYAVRLAQAVDACRVGALGSVHFSPAQLREIRYAALLHDFGKVGVREHVLCKEKKLHPDALQLLRERFHTARASNRAGAYQALVGAHLASGIDGAGLQSEQASVEAALAREDRRLDRFLDAVLQANEPRISARAADAAGADAAATASCLEELGSYRFRDVGRHARSASHAGMPRRLHCAMPSEPADAGDDAGDNTRVNADAGLPAEAVERRLLEPFELSALCLERGCLTADERRQIESHVSDTHAFLVLIPWTRELAGVPAIAHAHHEKLDGSGYPRQLRGEQIGIQSRILTICDIFDALTAADRPYKKAVALDAALALMQEECRSGHLDGALFDAFVQSRAWSPACA